MFTLIDELGGPEGLRVAVNGLYDRLLADERVSGWFEGADLQRIRAHQRKFLASAFAGPSAYNAREMAAAHHGLGVTGAAFDILLEHFAAVLAALGVSESSILVAAWRLEQYRTAVTAPA